MKSIKKYISIFLSVLMLMATTVTVFAAANGSITITNATVDETYKVYKIFDATVGVNGEISYTYNGTISGELATYFEADASGNISAKAAAKDADGNLVPGAVAALATAKGAPVQTKVADSSTVKFTGLEYGYYYIESTLNSAVSVTSTNPEATIIDKNQKPDWDNGTDSPGKVIIENNKKIKVNDAAIGDIINFDIGVNATNFAGEKAVTAYFINDKLPNSMTFNDDIKVKVGDTTLTEVTNYTITKNSDGYTFKINIPWYNTTNTENVVPLYPANCEIHVTYSATANENLSTAATGNVNEAEFDYATADPTTPPVTPPTTPDPNHDIPKRTTKTYSAKLELTKVDGVDSTKILTGAKFKITGTALNVVMINDEIYQENSAGGYWRLKDGHYTMDNPASHDQTKYESISQRYSKINTVTKDTDPSNYVFEGWVDTNGKLTFAGLSEGSYTITELVSPEGYNLLTDPISVEVKFDESDSAFSATVNGKKATVSDGTVLFNVENNAGTVLPGTGGIGTAIFYVLGSILVLGTAVVIITRKRMGREA